MANFGQSEDNCKVNRGEAKKQETSPTEPIAGMSQRWNRDEAQEFRNHDSNEKLMLAHKSSRQDGSQINTSTSFNILPITDGGRDETQNLSARGNSNISSRVYDQRLESITFPKNIYDSHDEYCDETQAMVDQALAMGLEDLDVAILLRNHIQRSPL